MKRKVRFAVMGLWLAVAVGMAGTAGCQSDGAEGPSASNGPTPANATNMLADGPRARALVPRSDAPVQDVPVPLGFRLSESLSRNYESPAGRVVDHTYQGVEPRADTVQFYRWQMPLRGWTERGTHMVQGSHVMLFEKKDEWAQVTVSLQPQFIGPDQTQVHVIIQKLQ